MDPKDLIESAQIDQEFEEIVKSLKDSGSCINGDNRTSSILLPEWVDIDKLERARVLCNKNLFGLFYSHLAGLSLLVHVHSILDPLVATKQSDSVSLLFKRYLTTLGHVKTWYEGKIWDERDPAFLSLTNVRRIHLKVASNLNTDIPVGEPVHLSQYDMMVTQFAFIGLIVVAPSKFGIHWSNSDLECVLHFWRLIGFLLGIDDQYNMCGHDNDYVNKLSHAILEFEIKKSFQQSMESASVGSQMSRGILESIRPYVPLIKWDPYLKYLGNVIGSDHQEMKLKWKDSLVYCCMHLTLRTVLLSSPLKKGLNRLLRRAIASANRKKKQITDKLNRKHEHFLITTTTSTISTISSQTNDLK